MIIPVKIRKCKKEYFALEQVKDIAEKFTEEDDSEEEDSEEDFGEYVTKKLHNEGGN